MHQNISFPVQKFSGHSHGISTVENPIPTLGTLCCLNPRAFDTRHQILHWPSNVSILVLYDWNPAQHCHQILHWPSNVSILVLYDWNMLISERRQIFKRSTSKLNWWWTSKHGLVMYTCGTQELTTVTQYQLNSI